MNQSNFDKVYSSWRVDFHYPFGSVYRDKFSLIQHVRHNRLVAVSLVNRQGTIITRWNPFTDETSRAIVAAYQGELVKRVGVMVDSSTNDVKRYCWCRDEKRWVRLNQAKELVE